MKTCLFWVYVISLQVAAIKVPIENLDENISHSTQHEIVEQLESKPIYYLNDESTAGSFLVPPNEQNTFDTLSSGIAAPATFLLPPNNEKVIEYYAPTESIEQTDWYPIAPDMPQTVSYPIGVHKQEPMEFNGNYRISKVLERNIVPVPSRILLPPAEDAPNFYFVDPSLVESEENVNKTRSNTQAQAPHIKSKVRQHSQKQNTPLLHRNPTGLYPKKFAGGFNPVPIPIAQYADGSLAVIPKAKPVKPLKPVPSVDGVYLTPVDNKKIYLFEQEEQKRKLKQLHKGHDKFNNMAAPMSETHNNNYERGRQPAPEQEASETTHDQPEPNVHAKPNGKVRQVYVPANKGERTEFRMHGMNGPHSYQFGFDTGKGKNRQFRFEERDNDGHVKGHYGYVDKYGKLRVVNYDADPQLGFRAEAPVVQE
ncbi:uncharacterized protein LOC126969533 [Leptidea sinapis]|uniref:uncharacterized protein LOC126969533 n=1 Tax=Leptidea sinapis TaxID=189913 RepID=UPI00213CE210|nr:uncharacterized protein LOC126969533 [Leptidea sinapis]